MVQSAGLNTPRFIADAVGTFNVITGVEVFVATEELKSVPEVPKVRAATEVTKLGLFLMKAPPDVAFQSIYSALRLAAGTFISAVPSKAWPFIVLGVESFVAEAALPVIFPAIADVNVWVPVKV